KRGAELPHPDRDPPRGQEKSLRGRAHGSRTRRASRTCNSTTSRNSPRPGWRITTGTPSTTWGASTARPSSSSHGSKAMTRRQPGGTRKRLAPAVELRVERVRGRGHRRGQAVPATGRGGGDHCRLCSASCSPGKIEKTRLRPVTSKKEVVLSG